MEEKYCKNCGKLLELKIMPNGIKESPSQLKRRKFCHRKCMSEYYSKNNSKAGDVSWYVAHERARRIHKNRVCEICGSTKNIDIHHKDENIQNNEPDNLMALCRSCHMKKHRKKGICKICGNPVKGHGYCEKHYQRWKKYGDPLYHKNKVKDV